MSFLNGTKKEKQEANMMLRKCLLICAVLIWFVDQIMARCFAIVVDIK